MKSPSVMPARKPNPRSVRVCAGRDHAPRPPVTVPLNQSASSSSHTFVVQMPSHVATAFVHPFFDLNISHLGICLDDELGVPDEPCNIVQHLNYLHGHFHVLGFPPSPPTPPTPPSPPHGQPPPLPPFYSSPIRLSVGNLSNTAEEFANGAVALYSSDLELLSDGAGSAAPRRRGG